MIYYINADTGNDSTGDGTSSLPWITISKAHTEATTGDTIICQSSTASYSFADQTFAKDLTFEGESLTPADQTFDGGSAVVGWNHAGYIINLYNLKFTGWGNTSKTLHNIIQVNDEIMTFQNCIWDGKLNTLLFYSIFTPQGGNESSNINVISCLLILDSGSTTNAPMINYGGSINSYINFISCTIYISGTGTQNYYFFTLGNGKGIVVLKNTIIYNVTARNIISAGASYLENSYSCVYNMTNAPAGTDNITTDPLFVDGANGNFNLRQTSPCLDTGTIL